MCRSAGDAGSRYIAYPSAAGYKWALPSSWLQQLKTKRTDQRFSSERRWLHNDLRHGTLVIFEE